MLMMAGVSGAEAQSVYTVFPAKVTDATVPATQPTNHGAAPPVTLAVQDSTLEYVVLALASQAHLRPIYDNGNAVFAKRITVHLAAANVMTAFAAVLKGTGMVAKVHADEETVVIGSRRDVSSAGGVSHSTGIVEGRVTDSASGAGLGGASVKVDGTKLSVVTSDSGHFTLKAVPPGEQVITVKLFGYKPVERTVTVVDSGRTTVKIALVPVPTVLSGVVTTAVGTQRKIEVGNDITTLNVDSIRNIAPITSLTDLLETRVPGLTVLHSSGVPGDPSRLRIRGVGSVLGNNDPIVIIDGIRVYAAQSDSRNTNLATGISPANTNKENIAYNSVTAVPSPLDQIDPANIETIDVLKGPSATAIYGSDATSGVIVITTKHGRAGPTHWSLQLADGVNWLPGQWPVNQYRFGSNGATNENFFGGGEGLCPWYGKGCAIDSVVSFQALNDPRYTVFSHGSDQQANLTVSGGVSTLTYNVTGSGAGNIGNLKLPEIEQQRYDAAYGPIPKYLIRPDNYTTWGVGGSLTALPTPAFQVTLQSSLFTNNQQQGTLNGAIAQLEGEYISPVFLNSSIENNGGLNGALIQNDVQRTTSSSQTSTNSASLQWRLRPWLPLTATGGISTIQRTDNSYVPFGVNPCGIRDVVSGCGIGDDTSGSYSVGHGTSRNQTVTVGTAIPLKLVTLALGGNLYSQSTTDLALPATSLSPGVSVPTSFFCPSGGTNCATQNTSNAATYGWYVQPTLNFASRFFASPGFRLDGGSGGSTSSGSVGGLSAFPKLDLSYVAVDRTGSQPLWGVLTQLRPRLAVGMAGTQPPPEELLRLFNEGTMLIGPGQQPGVTFSGGCNASETMVLDGVTQVPVVCLSTLGNTQLRPERTFEVEGGFDATLWRNRLTVTYTQYNKTTRDDILGIPVAPSVVGDMQYYANIGEVRNTGTELTIQANLLQSRAIGWFVGAMLSNDNNVVVHLNRGQQPICYGTVLGIGQGAAPCQGERLVAGYPLFGEWAQPIASFGDVNHDGRIELNEIVLADSSIYVGQPNPKYQASVNSTVSLLNGHLTINATFAYQNGLTQINQGACTSGAFLQIANAPNTSLATQAALVAAGCATYTGTGVGGLNGGSQIGFIQTVNTFRFNDLSINYTAPRMVVSWLRVPQLQLALQGRNLGLHTNYKGFDPDVNAFSTVSAGDETADLGQIPEPRTWWLRVTLGN